jgi:hypothetical protein
VPGDNYFDLLADKSRAVRVRSSQRLDLEDIDVECR